MARIAVFLFHRDLRLPDNTALLKAVRDGYRVLPVFVFPPEQIDPRKNKVFSHAAVQFMCESLQDLDQQLRTVGSQLFMLRGSYSEVLGLLSKHTRFQAIYSNRDESIYARQRDDTIAAWCKKNGVDFMQTEDYGLIPLKDGLLPDGRPYTVLQQYLNRFDKDLQVRVPDRFKFAPKHFVESGTWRDVPLLQVDNLTALYKPNPEIKVKGGRLVGIKRLKDIKRHNQYATLREYPGKEGTTRASAYLKFGCFSIREMYWEVVKHFGKHHGIIRELVFRDFYFKIYALDPELQRTRAFHTYLDTHIPWKEDKHRWDAWTQGRTGYPLVDAGMRQLATEGWMHNRVRMVVATVATRYMLLDWRSCAKFFYASLVDADPFSNTAGWQWSAGVGVQNMIARLRPPMNPFLQSKKYDVDGEYIKHWVPELRDIPSRDIHRWYEPAVRSKYATVTTYPAPVVDPKQASAATTKRFHDILATT